MAEPLVVGAELKRESFAARLDWGYLDATTLMEYLIRKEVPQRTAHHIVGSLVQTAMQRGVRLADLSIDEFQSAHASLDESVYGVRDLAGSASEHVAGPISERLRFSPVRGSSWMSTDGQDLRIATRNGRLPERGSIDCGVRLVAELPAVAR